MRILNPFQMNDWGIKRFLAVVLGIQAAIWVVVILDITLGWQIPIIRQILGIVYLLFIPGMLILRVFKLHNLGAIKSLLYSVGLSIAAVIFTGLLMNTLYPHFGISQPITVLPLTITFTVVVSILCILSCFRDRGFSNPDYLDLRLLVSPPALLLYLLPFLSVIGTFLVNQYQNNILLMTLIAVIALIVILIGFKKFIPEELYPLAIFCISLSLLFFRSFISFYISGFDIHEEFASATLVQSSGYWEPSTPILINGLLAINILPAMVSDISGLSMTMVFKVMYPLLFSITCVGLYQVIKNQTNALVAFFAVFFIVSAGRMYYDLALIPRQLTGSLFLIISIVLLVERDISERVRVIFLVIMGFSLVLSHYGLAYIYLAILLCSVAVNWLVGSIYIQSLWKGIRSRLGGFSSNNTDTRNKIRYRSGVVILFVFLFIVITMAWYIYTAGGVPVNTISQRLADFAKLITTDLFHPTVIPPIEAEIPSTVTVNILNNLSTMSVYFKEILFIVGCLAVIWSVYKMKLSRIYLGLCFFPVILYIATFSSLGISLFFVTCLLLVVALVLPTLRRRLLICLILANLAVIVIWIFFPEIAAKYGAPSLERLINSVGSDSVRLQNIAFLLVAIFLVIGFMVGIGAIVRIIKRSQFNSTSTAWIFIMCIFLAGTLLLDTGFALQATDNYSSSPSLNQAWVKARGNVVQKAGLYSAVTPEQDVISAEWLKDNMMPNVKIYATFGDVQVHPLTSYGLISADGTERMSTQLKEIPDDSYIYLQYLNVIDGEVSLYSQEVGIGRRFTYFDIKELVYLWADKNRIYTNGGSEVYR